MNILFVVPYVPTLIRVRPYNIVRFLAQHGNRLTLATLWETEEECERLADFATSGLEVIGAPLSRARKLINTALAALTLKPLQANFCWQPNLAAALDRALASNSYDAVHVEHLRGSGYALHIKKKLRGTSRRPPIIWDSVDSITYLFEQASRQSQSLKGKLMTAFELPRTRHYEGWLVSQFDHVLVTSRVDKKALEAISTSTSTRRAPISVMPNGVDLTYFSPVTNCTARDQDTLVFSGKMSYHANVTAALYLVNDIMPRVWAQRPQVKVWIVGKDPTPAVQALARSNPGHVIVTGSVPDLGSYLQRATVAVVPVVYGAGVQNKVLEAMACATPVVASKRAVSALRATDGKTLLVADSTEAFAQRVLQALGDPVLWGQLSSAGRAYVETYHNWDTIVRRLEDIYVRSRV